MTALVLRLLWTRRLRAAAQALALLVATVGFQAVLVGSRATQSHVSGVIAANRNPSYDLLVHGSSIVPGLTAADHLIRPNYLDTSGGGITLQQVDTVRGVPGVVVAAPLGVVATDYLWFQDYAINLTTLPRSADLTVYRVTTSFITDGGTSTIPGRTDFAVVAGSNPPFVAANIGPRVPMEIGGSLVDCPSSCYGPESVFPYQAQNRLFLPYSGPWKANRYPYVNQLTAPIVAVDPAAEDALSGVSNCLTSGRNLTAADHTALPLNVTENTPAQIPVLVNAHPGFDERVRATVDVSSNALAELRPSLANLLPEGGTFRHFLDLPLSVLDKLSYQTQVTISGDLNAAWNATDGVGFTQGSLVHPAVDESQQEVRPITYSGRPPHLAARRVPLPNADVAYRSPFPFYNDAIDESADTAFRSLRRLEESIVNPPWHSFNVVGKYDPRCMRGASSTVRSASDIYANPDTLMPSGRAMGPNASITNFVAPMPLIMTNLAGGQFFSDHQRFSNGGGAAFLSVIRVKVGNTDHPGADSQARLEQVAAEIHVRTGLAVDIVNGSSTQSMAIDLPAGRFGRSEMTVRQDWLTENVAIKFLNAISRTSLILAVAVAVIAVLFTAQASFATVRRRRQELLVLRALGWPSWRIGVMVELELLVTGLLISGAAILAGTLMIAVARPDRDVSMMVLLACPIAIGVTALAGVGPALRAARMRSAADLHGPGRGHRRGSQTLGPLGLGLREALTTWRWQTLVGALATAVGAFFLGAVLALTQHFRSSLDTSALADQLASEVGPFDTLLGVLAVVLGAVTAVSIVLVATRERLPHYATLRALGWSRAHIARLVAAQAMTVGVVGGGLGAIALWVVGARLEGGLTLTLWSAIAPLGLGLTCGVIAAFEALRLVHGEVISVLRDS